MRKEKGQRLTATAIEQAMKKFDAVRIFQYTKYVIEPTSADIGVAFGSPRCRV